MASGPRIAQMTRMRPPQEGQRRASMRQTRMRRSAQGMLFGRFGATGAVVLAGSGGVGTMCARNAAMIRQID